MTDPSYDRTNPALERDTGGVTDRVAKSVTMLWLVTMLTRLMQLITTAILARLLNPGDYGLIALAMTVVGFLDLITNIQIGGAVLRTKDLSDDHLASAFTINLLRGVFTALLLCAFADPVANFMGDARLVAVLRVLAAGCVMNGLHNPYFMTFARNIDYRREAMRNGLAAIFGGLAGVAAAFIFRSYWALVAGPLSTNFIAMATSYWRVPRLTRLSLSKAGEFISFGSWLVLINIAEYINAKVDYLLIGKGLGDRALGAYHVGQQINVMVTGDVVGPINQALIPAFSIVSDDPDRLRTGYRRLQTLTLAIALPIGFGISMLGRDIITLLVGGQWEQAIPVIHIIAPLTGLQTMIASVESLALATNRGKTLVIRTFVFLGIRSLLMVAGFYTYGYLGIIYARTISGTLYLIYGLKIAASITQSRWYDPIAMSWRSFTSVGAMIGLLWLVPDQLHFEELSAGNHIMQIVALGAKVLLGGVTYAGTHLILWNLCGRPDGAESTLIQQIRRVLSGMGRRLARR